MINNKWEIEYEMDDETLKEAILLDKEAFDEIDVVDYNRCKIWLKKNNEIYTVLKYDGEFVGYINFVAISDEAYSLYRSGEAKDYFLQSKDIMPFRRGKNHKCLLLSIVIRKEYRDGEAIKILSNALSERIQNFESRGIHISKVIQDCVSMDGIKFVLNFFGAKYVCDSLGGKIYEADLDSERKIYPLELRYEEINEENIKTIARIQYEIFKDSNCVGYCDYLEELDNKDRFKNKLLPVNFLVYLGDVAVGIVGLYELEDYKEDIWLNWLGVLPEYRKRGIGTSMLLHVIKLSKEYKRNNFRLFSYENWHQDAISIYKKTMQIQENYLSKDDDYSLMIDGGCKIFSCSLIDKKPTFWDNKFIGLNKEKELHLKSVKALIDDKIIESNIREEVMV